MKRQPKTYTLKKSVIDALDRESKRQERTRSQVVERILEKELIKNENN